MWVNIHIDWLFNYIDENNKRQERVASIEDVKNQLTILINEKFSSIRDRREYRSELLPLLKELE
jgi:phage baseplate assembly protein W